MKRRLTVALVAIASLVVSGLFAGSAMAQAPENAKLKIVGNFTLEVNKFIKDSQRFHKKKRKVQSGGTLTIVNKSKAPDPHTFSLLNKEARPDSADEIFNCEACNALLEQHGDSTFTLNAGAEGFDSPGDSQFIAPPEAPGDQVTLNITAPAGTRLFGICLIHPWMQTKVVVTENA
jgi:hypothetical protein